MKRRALSDEQKAAARAKRAALASISEPIQIARQAGLMPWAEFPTLNDCLISIYSQRTGQTEWHTFVGWLEKGFAPRKGEQGFAIWGQPIRIKSPASEATPAAEAATEPTEKTSKFFPLSYVFHAGQVEAKAKAA